MKPQLSVVIPIHNEAANLLLLIPEIYAALSPVFSNFEVLCVDDGSADRSAQILKELAGHFPIKNIFLSKRQGKGFAVREGVLAAKADWIVVMDADLQNPPDEILKLYAALQNESADMVCGWRKSRCEMGLRTLASQIFNFLLKVVWNLPVHDCVCGLRIFKKSAVPPEMGDIDYRWLPLILTWQGKKITEVIIQDRPRKFGKSNYGLKKYIFGWMEPFILAFRKGY